MPTVYWMIVGVLAVAMGAAYLGSWLRRHPSKEVAEETSRIMHFLFFAGMVGPGTLAFLYPGYQNIDTLLGVPSLPWRAAFLALGIVLAVPALYLLVISNQLLRSLGQGANAFRLTSRIVESDIYTRTRNPMSLGFYLAALAVGLIAGSTFTTLGALLGTIPAHLLFLKYFEEKELELRFGKSYLEYRRRPRFSDFGPGDRPARVPELRLV
jgi:protein-S-isoprenylcysteine O-methyltransferase Ste14